MNATHFQKHGWAPCCFTKYLNAAIMGVRASLLKPALQALVILFFISFISYPALVSAHYIKISFDKEQPGSYSDLVISSVRFSSRSGTPFEIRALNRPGTSSPNVLVVPVGEVVDLTFEKIVGTVTGIGVTLGLLQPGPAEQAIFGATVKYPGPAEGLPAPVWPLFPPKTTLMEYAPSDKETQLSFQLQLDQSHVGISDGVRHHFSFGNYLGVIKDDTFDGKPGVGVMDRSGQGGGGAFFDDLTLEVSVGPAIPYVVNGNHDAKVDLIFMPDQTYKNDFKKFFRDLSTILNGAFQQNKVFQDNKTKFNIYSMNDEATVSFSIFGTGSPPARWSTWSSSTSTSDRGFADDYPFADSVGILVRGDPYISGGFTGASYPSLPNGGGVFWFYSHLLGTFLHEAGHAIFRLAGEYCASCVIDNGKPSDPNIWSSELACRQKAQANGWNPDDCKPICDKAQCPGTWWKIDEDCVMGNVGNQYGQACTAQINQYLGTKP